MTANTYSSPRYIRVQWPWISMIYKIWHVWSSPCTIYNILESPLWIYTKDQDLHRNWRYTMDQDLHNGWRYLTYTGIKSWEMKSHEHWHDKGGSISEIPPSGNPSTQYAVSTCPTMWIEVSRSNIVVHHLITGHWCIPLTDTRSPTDNENGNQGTRVQSNKCK